MMQKFFSLQQDPEDLGITFAADDFEPASLQDREDFYAKAPSVSYWKDAWRRLKSNKVAMVSLVFLIFVVIFAFLGPLFVKGDYTTQFRGDENLFPCLQYPFGTDKLGRNILTRVMYGTRVSLIVGIFASLIVLVIGSIYGAVSGYLGGKVDSIMMRILDLIYSVPDVLVVILISIAINKPLKDWVNNSGSQFAKKIGVLGPALISIFIVFGLLYWVGMARIIRGQVLMLKEQEFITAVRALGGSKKRIIKRHIFPNCIGQIIVMTAMQIPSAIFLESFLSFLGIGVSAPMTSLGAMAADALGGIYSYAYRLVIPSILLSLIILSLNLFSDGLRDALDPRLKK
ncbi:oligopeptide transport system permease protein [Peptoniphilus koenoeneniae]|uniref:Oligopeptide transport system permease protein n=2 Tax=Peptoniphilaceae TaxID=1570339 RepID=A0ABU0AU51_9FIRM|nr:oligopeptide transport system permease protein [Peptoniphilus koenoeneniae]